MKRDAEQTLSEWNSRPGRKPLLLRGARQVGKTYLVESWARNHFESVVTVDLERERELHSLFSLSDTSRLLEELALLKRQPLVPGQCLLFLDEIQACPQALAQLRYFHERVPDLHVIAAGSLLDFALRDFKYSMPVGRIEFLHLHPMSFEEFLQATEGLPMVEYLRRMSIASPPSPAVEQRLLAALRAYFFVGGMPEAVRAFIDRRDLLEVQRIQTSLVETVQADFAKYGPARLHRLIRETYRHVGQNVGRKIKWVNISREERSNETRQSMELLTLSRVVNTVVHTSANGLPLGAERDDRHFKAIFLDIGLVNRLCGLELVDIGMLLTAHEGALAEQFVGQQLLCMSPSFEEPQLFYWIREARNANAEVDFLISHAQQILPLEVKAGKSGTLRSAFQFLREKKRTKAVRLYLGPFSKERIALPGEPSVPIEILSLPLYAIGQLDRMLREEFGPT